MTAKQLIIQDIKLVDFPEEVDVQNGIKIYGEPIGSVKSLPA